MLVNDNVKGSNLNHGGRLLPPTTTWYEDSPDDEQSPTRAQSPSPEAPPDNTRFYPAKHLADEFELIRKHNPRAIAQQASVGINSLPDSTWNLPWVIIITAAIIGSPQQRLHLAEIQAAVALRFRFLADTNITNSFRDTLSKNKKFGRMPRPRGEDRLFGDWWFVVDHPPVQVEPRPVPTPRPDPLPPFQKFLLVITFGVGGGTGPLIGDKRTCPTSYTERWGKA
ncbi:hypothetical protein JB92DRAFT_3093627 [Gautieria morchelliformis]|nr:hypothetical protein JB92DRAFT_3093627 [Gautieria morchelliformis]